MFVDEADWRQMMQKAYAGLEHRNKHRHSFSPLLCASPLLPDSWTFTSDESDDDVLEHVWGRMAEDADVEEAKDASGSRKLDFPRFAYDGTDLNWLAPAAVDADKSIIFPSEPEIAARAGRSRRRSLSKTSASEVSTSASSLSSSSPCNCPSSPCNCPGFKRARMQTLSSGDEEPSKLTDVHDMRHDSMTKGLEYLAITNQCYACVTIRNTFHRTHVERGGRDVFLNVCAAHGRNQTMSRLTMLNLA